MNSPFTDEVQFFLCDLMVAFHDHFLSLRINKIVGDNPANYFLPVDRHLFDPGTLHLTENRSGKFLTFLDDQVIGFWISYVRADLGPEEMLRVKQQRRLATVKNDRVAPIIVVQQILCRHSQCTQQNRCMKLAATVDAYIKNVTRVKLKIDPRTAIGDHPGGIEQLSASMSLSFVVFEEDPWGTVKLANDNPFGSVNHERAVLGHQGNLTEVNFLFFHVFDAAGAGLRVDVPQD